MTSLNHRSKSSATLDAFVLEKQTIVNLPTKFLELPDDFGRFFDDTYFRSGFPEAS